MNPSNTPSLARFAIRTPVQVPHGGCFRIHPDIHRSTPEVYLVRCNDGWWLVDPDVCAQVRIPNLCKAQLYEGIYDDGRSVVVVVSSSVKGREGWNKTLSWAVAQARDQWISITSDKANQCYIPCAHHPNEGLADPVWRNADFDAFVLAAFKDRIIFDVPQAQQKWMSSSYYRDIEESVD